MSFAVESPLLASNGTLELDEDKYNQSIEDLNIIDDCLAVEEKFDVLLENFREFEQEMLDLTLRFQIRHRRAVDMWDAMNLLNRRIINLLTSCRLYLDHTGHHINNVFGKDSTQFVIFNEWKATAYDTSFAYRIMEALRNYVQHRGYPLHGIRFNKKTNEDPYSDGEYFRVDVDLDIEEIDADGKFKASVLTELRSESKPILLKKFIREYVAEICNIHIKVRAQLSPEFDRGSYNITDLKRQFATCNPQDIGSSRLVIIKKFPDGRWINTRNIIEEVISRRAEYVEKNVDFAGFSGRHVSGSIRKNPA